MRVLTGIVLMVDSVLSLLPLGRLFLVEDLPLMHRLIDRLLCWIGARHTQWMGLSPPIGLLVISNMLLRRSAAIRPDGSTALERNMVSDMPDRLIYWPYYRIMCEATCLRRGF